MLQAAQKPLDAASDWKEFTSPDGRKYYHNRKTKESKWTMPEEMKRAQAAAAAATTTTTAAPTAVQKPAAAAPPPVVKVPVAQTSSPAPTSKSPQVCFACHTKNLVTFAATGSRPGMPLLRCGLQCTGFVTKPKVPNSAPLLHCGSQYTGHARYIIVLLTS